MSELTWFLSSNLFPLLRNFEIWLILLKFCYGSLRFVNVVMILENSADRSYHWIESRREIGLFWTRKLNCETLRSHKTKLFLKKQGTIPRIIREIYSLYSTPVSQYKIIYQNIYIYNKDNLLKIYLLNVVLSFISGFRRLGNKKKY